MGNSSSQVQDDAPDRSQLRRSQTPLHEDPENDQAASSQLFSEIQSSVALSPDGTGKEKKSMKSKKKKRKSREAVPDTHTHTDKEEHATPDARQGASQPKSAAALTQPDINGVTQSTAEPKPRESRSKHKKDKKTAQDVLDGNPPATHDGAQDADTAEREAGKTSTKKRKRKSEDTAHANATDRHQSADADSKPAEEPKDIEDSSRKKQKKSKRSSTGTAADQAKNSPASIPTFTPPVAKEPEVQPTRKSKRKTDAADAAKSSQTENIPASVVQTSPRKDKRTSTVNNETTKDSAKKQKKPKKTHNHDNGDASAGLENPTRHNASEVELSVIDPALLPPTQQEALVREVVEPLIQELPSRKKSKKSKKTHSDTAAPTAQDTASADMVSTAHTANGIFGNANDVETTGERAYIEHQQKKQKRKRQAEQAAETVPTPSQQEVAEPKPRKRKTASEAAASAENGTTGSSSKTLGAKPKGTEDFPSSGPYTKKEIETLTRAIEGYREYNDLTQIQVNDIVQAGVFNQVHGKSCKEFWDDVCPCLPNRWSRETIIKFVRRKWHNFDKRGKWDPDEDQMLKEAYARTPGQWTKIGESVGRFADDCRDRWRNYLSCSDTMASKRWHDSEVNELLNVVQDCLNTLLERLPNDTMSYWREELQSTERRDIWRPDEIRNLVRKMPDCMEALRAAFDEKHPRESKQKRATEKRRGSSATDGSVVINWDLVSEKMGKKRSRLQIMSKWKALEHTYSQDPKETFFTEANHWRVENGQKWAEQMLPGDKYNVVRAMLDLGLTNEERIIWNTVAHHELVKLKWAHQAKMTFINMKELVPDQESLPQLLESLKEYFEVRHGDELDRHWRYDGRPGRTALKSGTRSPGPLDWRGHMRGESSYKSNARVTDDDVDEDGEENVKAEY